MPMASRFFFSWSGGSSSVPGGVRDRWRTCPSPDIEHPGCGPRDSRFRHGRCARSPDLDHSGGQPAIAWKRPVPDGQHRLPRNSWARHSQPNRPRLISKHAVSIEQMQLRFIVTSANRARSFFYRCAVFARSELGDTTSSLSAGVYPFVDRAVVHGSLVSQILCDEIRK